MKRGTAEDGKFRARVECLWSSRFSPSIPSIPPDLSGVLEDGMSPINEGVESIEKIWPSVAASVGDPVRHSLVAVDGALSDGREGEMDLGLAVVADSTSDFVVSQAMVEGLCQREGVADCPSNFDDSLAMVEGVCQRIGVAVGTFHGEHGFPCPVADVVIPPSLVAGGVVPPSSVFLRPSQAVQVVSHSHYPSRSADAVSFDGGVVPASYRAGDDRPETAEPSRDGCVVADAVCGGILNGVLQNRTVSHLSMLSDDVSLCGGGMVSEEGRALPVAGGGALRPQPTDGLRQPLSCPVEPVSAVAGGVGLDGRSDVRSYAHVVQVSHCGGAVEPIVQAVNHYGGVVSEEVPPLIREAVRPQPADGLGQPPRSTVEPVVERAVGIDHSPGHRSFAMVINPDRACL
ncbi:hypothetical protein Dimus_033542 [Dionaea muscipula]